jgi:hypothetical protein
MHWRALVTATTVALTLATSGCGASSEGNRPTPTPTPRDCRSLTFPYPTADATLGAADSGKTVHVPVGGLVEVDLLGSPSRRWSPIVLTGTGVISLGTQAATATVGTRLGEYCAVGDGRASLSASDGTVQWMTEIAVP